MALKKKDQIFKTEWLCYDPAQTGEIKGYKKRKNEEKVCLFKVATTDVRIIIHEKKL